MFELKYFPGYLTAAHELSPSADLPPFRIEDIAASGLFARVKAAIFRSLTLFALAFCRSLWPNAQIGRLLVVSRAEDVKEVLENRDVFAVPYGPEMIELAGGANFALGMDGGPHDAQRSVIQSILKREDLDALVAQTRSVTSALITASGGRIDVMRDLITRVATETCLTYFGLDARDHDGFAAWSLAISNLLFADITASEVNRRLALSAASNLRAVIDRAVQKAKSHGANPNTLVGRLVQLQAADSTLDDATIRAILVGLVTGFIPTTTLGGANMLLELLRRPSQMCAAKALAKQGDSAGLQALLQEAERLNPALLPGQWRYAVADGEIAGGTWRRKKVRKDTVLMVSTASALRDPRAFPSAGIFNAERRQQPDLMFGWASHSCLGNHIAMAQITEIFLILLSQTDLRRASGRDGKLQWVGPFPSRLDMEFDPAPVAPVQNMIVVTVPVDANMTLEALQEDIGKLGNPAGPTYQKALDDTGIVHFASLSAVDGGEEGKPKLYLALELNVDGERDWAIRKVVEHAGDWLAPIFAYANPKGLPLANLLCANALTLHTLPWGAIGLNFNGTPEFSVATIRREAALATYVKQALDIYLSSHIGIGNRAVLALDYVRKLIRQDPFIMAMAPLKSLAQSGHRFQDLLFVPSRKQLKISSWTAPSGNWDAFVKLCQAPEVVRIFWIFGGFILAASLSVFLSLPGGLMARISLSIIGGMVAILLFPSLLVIGFLLILRAHEEADIPDDRPPDLDALRKITRSENHHGYAQNHIIAVPILKPGWFRKLTLALSLWGIEKLVSIYFRPGFVLNMGTIHYAKWFRLPGTEKFIFLANYDGSWESYLEDFIMKAHNGQSAAWSNGIGFPRTRFLVFDGAQDGDRFKRWVRRQQNVSPFWYSGYPALTTDQIRNNALIRQGLAQAVTDTTARAWLECFGTMQRPDNVLEADDVQSLMFRGMREFPFASCAVIELPDARANSKVWLAAIMPGQQQQTGPSDTFITFGDHSFADKSHETANFVAFSATGLAKLGLNTISETDGLATFPAAFRLGMATRRRELGDMGASAPERWYWADAIPDTEASGGPAPAVGDVVLFFYARTASALRDLTNNHLMLLNKHQGKCLRLIQTSPGPKGLDFENFGFRDGISQPVIRGTQRFAKGTLPRDIVEAGEFILGYPNNQGHVPPSFTVSASSDGHDHLAVADPPAASSFPGFGDGSPTSDRRDIGRNGSFLVVRQLEQHVDEFDSYTATEACRIRTFYANLPSVTGSPISAEWIAAKLMGRWRDGTPLVDRSVALPRGSIKRDKVPNSDLLPDDDELPDNDFAYGIDDPLGLQCPLGAHIRRANPRDGLQLNDPFQQQITNRHRILRRGRSYEVNTNDGSAPERGLLFVCICGDIERQFEFVQQTWSGGRSFQGLVNELDPILAQEDFGGSRTFTIPTPSGPVTLRNMKKFVTVRGGGYFFLPGRMAIQYLIDLL